MTADDTPTPSPDDGEGDDPFQGESPRWRETLGERSEEQERRRRDDSPPTRDPQGAISREALKDEDVSDALSDS